MTNILGPTMWRPVPTLPGVEVSEDGHLRDANDHQLLSTEISNSGQRYLRVVFHDDDVEYRLVREIILDTCLGEARRWDTSVHLDGDPSNCALSNLRRLSPSELAKHRLERGDLTRGAVHPNSVLTEDDIRAIRSAWATPVPCPLLAIMFGVSASTIRKIQKRQSWKHVADE